MRIGHHSREMRSVLLAAVLLTACAGPAGVEPDECDASWREVESVVLEPARDGEALVPVPVSCMRRIDDRRVRIGFLMPAGPTCYRLAAVEVVEGAHAASIALFAAADDDPSAGACPDDPPRTATEIDLQAPVEHRRLLDGNGQGS